ncbi:MAG: leucine-rich repeat domain-containing protein [Coriobacteriales bacterium]|nr:leucine-rich repeat domain-containing protein [Coriobacteriales bacterium]
MQALICKVCDSNHLVMDGDMLVCQHCGTRYTLETARKMMGTVKVEGVVQTRGADFDIKAGTLMGYSGASRDVVVPDGVDAIGQGAFKGANITSVTLPNSVTKILNEAFSGCTELARINIPRGVKSIAYRAFEDCTALTAISLPANIDGIGYGAFERSGIKSIIIPPGTTQIPNGAFRNMSALTAVSIPNSVRIIGTNAFEFCSSLKSVVIPFGVTTIGSHAFDTCSSLEQVQLPNSLKVIDDAAFWECRSLKSIVIPASVTKIGCAFGLCTSLEQIVLYTPTQDISPNAFEGPAYQKNQTRLLWRRKGLCQHCGSYFRGTFTKVCCKCGKPKDY